mgnify:CR=1 FL=1
MPEEKLRSACDGATAGRLSRRNWIEAAALALGSALIAASQTEATPAPLPPNERRKCPDLAISTTDGQTVEVNKQPGKVVLVDVMMTTCPSCKMASESIQRLYKEFGAKGFLPVAIAIDPQAENVLPLYKNLYGLTFPVGVIPRRQVLDFLSHPADKPLLVPTLVLIDKRGRIGSTQVGWIGEAELRSLVTKLLAE